MKKTTQQMADMRRAAMEKLAAADSFILMTDMDKSDEYSLVTAANKNQMRLTIKGIFNNLDIAGQMLLMTQLRVGSGPCDCKECTTKREEETTKEQPKENGLAGGKCGCACCRTAS